MVPVKTVILSTLLQLEVVEAELVPLCLMVVVQELYPEERVVALQATVVVMAVLEEVIMMQAAL